MLKSLNKRGGGRTVAERLQPTLDHAIIEKDKSSAKARLTGWTLNIAIGLQVLLGSLTTGLSALSVSGGKSVNNFFFLNVFSKVSNILVHLLKDCKGNNSSWYVVMTRHSNGRPAQSFYIGALATLVASYLARARGSNEPEVSLTRAKNLDQFIRECRAFQMDHGHVTGNQFDEDLIGFRHRFEELLGNVNGWVPCMHLRIALPNLWWLLFQRCKTVIRLGLYMHFVLPLLYSTAVNIWG